MQTLNLKPTHKPVREYYNELQQYENIGVSHEGAVRVAFQNLLDACCKQFDWKLVTEWKYDRPGRRPASIDGACVDEFRLVSGYWEAKDEQDDLKKEVRSKFKDGYPKNNILFQSPTRAILYQDGKQVVDSDITDPKRLIEVLERFFQYSPPAFKEWGKAVEQFRDKVPDLGFALLNTIKKEYKESRKFRDAFDTFYEVCKKAINPNLSRSTIEEMLIQHLLTERVFRKVFNNPDFSRRNIIAAEIEKVIDALTARSFSREAFMQKLDPFYKAIELTAATISNYSEKQSFLNVVYEKFFQGYAIKEADTHGIVYTPQPIVEFMVKSVADLLSEEFSRSLSDEKVRILDPFVGTGNFIIRTMREIKKSALSNKYKTEVHCNEVMLLPYYIASMNIENEYLELTKSYEPFEGICLVDTFELAEGAQGELAYMSEENAARIERQKKSPIYVVIGNPPYNAKQVNENDNNKNRKYKKMDKRVSDTYGRDSSATLLNKTNDPYIKAIRWASDRIKEEGVVALVTNNSFIEDSPFDGMRKHLAQDFDALYILDLGGSVWRNTKLSGTKHNVFGIKLGVSINLFIRKKNGEAPKSGKIYYARVDEYWTKEQKYEYLLAMRHRGNIDWQEITPDKNYNWLTEGLYASFDGFIPMGTKQAKALEALNVQTIFKTYSLGPSTNRDKVVYDFDRVVLLERVEQFCDDYSAELSRYEKKGKPKDVDNFVNYEKIKWSRNLKRDFKNGISIEFDPANVRTVIYRPYTNKELYLGETIVDEPGSMQHYFPNAAAEKENLVIAVCNHSQSPFSSQMLCRIAGLDVNGRPTQCFPFYTYKLDGTSRRENITDWTLGKFQKHYKSDSITKWDIFYYVYAILQHPTYRQQYALDLKKRIPRIPFASKFQSFVDAGKKLAELHAYYYRIAKQNEIVYAFGHQW
jgi:predicted helicase